MARSYFYEGASVDVATMRVYMARRPILCARVCTRAVLRTVLHEKHIQKIT